MSTYAHHCGAAPGSDTRSILADLVSAIVREADPERIILFGSRATGAAGSDSDFDLLVVETRPFGPERSRRREVTRLWRAVAHVPVAKDILVYSRDEVERWRHARNHVVHHALQQGTTVYERP